MVQRKNQAQIGIQEKVETQKKEKADAMDAEFAKMLSLEEQQSLTEAKKKLEEIQRRDDIALSIVQEYPHIDY